MKMKMVNNECHPIFMAMGTSLGGDGSGVGRGTGIPEFR